MTKRTPKNHKNSHNTPIVLCWHEEKNLKAIRGNVYRFVPKGGVFPTKNHHACCEKLWFVISIYPNLRQMRQKIYHDMLMPLNDSMPSFMNFKRVLDLLEFKNQASQCFDGKQRCPGVWNSFPFLAWDLSMHPRTQIWLFNQFICTGACACSSNLNYAHKCIENSNLCCEKHIPKPGPNETKILPRHVDAAPW